MATYVGLDGDERFASEVSRRENDATLTEILAEVLATKTKQTWEAELTIQDVGCVEVAERNSEAVLQTDPFFEDFAR